MPWCPKCGAEYRSGYTICANCQTPLTDTPPCESQSAADQSLDLVLLCERSLDTEAELLRQFLLDNGIPVMLQNRSEIDALASVYTGYTFTGKRILVNRDDLPRAQELLRAFQSGRAELLETQAEAAPAEEEPETGGGSGVILIPAILLALLFLAMGYGLIGILLLIAAAALKQLWDH